jgi:dTDP-4-amino-4,6-dideoxygalactose transaminase
MSTDRRENIRADERLEGKKEKMYRQKSQNHSTPKTDLDSLAIQEPKPRVFFIESKTPDFERISQLLATCQEKNQWANEGPLFHQLIEAYRQHMNLPPDHALFPCSNGAVALEAMARLHELKHGRRLRWVASSFSFSNLGRGYFSDVAFLDCDEAGLLDLSILKDVGINSYDGVIVTNPHGVCRDFQPFIDFAKQSGKALLFDNAAGMDTQVPDWPWQCFSLHHTKPYGVGEGGLALVPVDEYEKLRSLLVYGPTPFPAACWFNNGKLSDISCAFHLDRLARFHDWAPLYLEQTGRVIEIAESVGLSPLLPFDSKAIAMSWPLLAKQEITSERCYDSRSIVVAKYYKPLASTPRSRDIFNRLVNFPTHPDVAQLTDEQIRNEMQGLLLHGGSK